MATNMLSFVEIQRDRIVLHTVTDTQTPRQTDRHTHVSLHTH